MSESAAPPRASTPPPRPAPIPLTPDQVKRIEINRLKAKARLQQRQNAAAASTSSPASNRNGNNKRPMQPAQLQVTPATSSTPTIPKAPAPLRRDKTLGTYFDYDLSKMVNSKGGYLMEDSEKIDERTKMLEKQRETQRAAQKHDPPIFLDPSLNPKCVECNSIDIDHVFKKIFGVLVCNKCKNEFPEKYSLLTKTECKEDYLLTNPELRDTDILPHLLKANPHKATWNNMMLFLREQVEAFAFKKWGGPDGLDAEWEKRVQETKKKKGRKFEKGLRDLRKKTRESMWQMKKDEEHKHEFGVVERVGSDDEGDGRPGPGVQRCIECGFEIEVEEF